MDKLFQERAGAIALCHAFGYEPAISRSLVENLGGAAAVFNLSEKELSELFGAYSRFRGRLTRRVLDDSAGELEDLTRRGYRFVSIGEDCYPELLRDCPDAPAGLYIKSSDEPSAIFNTRPGIAVVGTRDISPYGHEWCSRIVRGMAFAKRKPVVISGLAIGADICAHRSALDAGLPTIAVLPTGITGIYPQVHNADAERIASTPGCALVSDYPPGTAPQAFTFLRRNRIIAGMAQATVLIESKEKGGGMITSYLASGYGRDLYVLPGRADDLRSAGCNRLLLEKKAEPICSVGGFLESAGLGCLRKGSATGFEDAVLARYGGDSEMAAVAGLIRRRRGISTDELGRVLGVPPSRVGVICGTLEKDGFITIDLLSRCFINPKID